MCARDAGVRVCVRWRVCASRVRVLVRVRWRACAWAGVRDARVWVQRGRALACDGVCLPIPRQNQFIRRRAVSDAPFSPVSIRPSVRFGAFSLVLSY